MLPRSYNSINNAEEQPDQSLSYRIQIHNWCMDFCKSPLGSFISLVLLGMLLIAFFIILCTGIGIFIVLFNTIFEIIIVSMFGEEIYKKNFPICNCNSYYYHLRKH